MAAHVGIGLTIGDTTYQFRKGYYNSDYDHVTNSLFPIKKGTTYKLSVSGCTVYKVGMEYMFTNEEERYIADTEISELIRKNTVLFPNYADENRTTITSNTEYTVTENSWLMFEPNSNGSSSLVLTVDNATYSLVSGTTNWDYSHPTHLMFPLKKGSIFKVTFSAGSMYLSNM